MKGFKKVLNVITTILVILAVLLAVALVGVRLIGFQVFTVLSGSMEPTYHVGSLIYVQKTDPESIKVGDPITFVLNDDLVVATHRVVEIDRGEDGALRFTTKGDANAAIDGSPVHQNNLIGVPKFTIPYLGYFSSYVQHPPGTYVAIAAGAVLILLLFLPELIKTFSEGDKKGKEEPEK